MQPAMNPGPESLEHSEESGAVNPAGMPRGRILEPSAEVWPQRFFYRAIISCFREVSFLLAGCGLLIGSARVQSWPALPIIPVTLVVQGLTAL